MSSKAAFRGLFNSVIQGFPGVEVVS